MARKKLLSFALLLGVLMPIGINRNFPQKAFATTSLWQRSDASFSFGTVRRGQTRLAKTRSLSQKAEGRAASTLSYYLVWSPGIWPKMLCSFATMVTLQLVGGHLFSSSGLTCPAGLSLVRPIWDLFLLPLLSSACCGIQLVINALVGASGCAGFNKWFGPLRPYFLGCLFSTTAVSIFRRHGNFRFVWLQCILAFLPELVHLWNLHGPQRQIGATPSHTVDLSIASMGCVACIKKVESSLREVPGVLRSEAWLEDGGRARVQCSVSETEVSELTARLSRAVERAGFEPCRVIGVNLEEP
ncbi:unnamed protein product [Symbiodinium necroappetens]|uniref:HMA domain-containing protein n=1 Tax=Symbiodinium necroappetens TaxID=1628268 RepID=A0A812R8S1_9DINO|nr:unnamed protein product [Symbiodinium necroappetens]